MFPLLNIYSENTPRKYKITCSHGNSFISSLFATPICGGGESSKFPFMETNWCLFPSEYHVAIQKGKDAMNCFGRSEKKARWRIKKESKNIYIFIAYLLAYFYTNKQKSKFINVNGHQQADMKWRGSMRGCSLSAYLLNRCDSEVA